MSKITSNDPHQSHLMPLVSPEELKQLENTHLDSLAHTIYEALKQDSAASPTTKLSLFGLKNAAQVRAFLKSPAGDSLISEINKTLALEKNFLENKVQAILQQEMLMHFIKSSFYLWRLEHQADAANNKDLLLLLNQQAIERAKPVHNTDSTQEIAALREAISNYQEALNLNTALLNTKVQEKVELDALEQTLLKQEKSINDKFEQFLTKLAGFEKQWSLSQEELEQFLSTTQDEIDAKLHEISTGIEKNEDVSELIKEFQMLQYALLSYDQHQAINKGNKYYADAEGKEVSSLDDAHFILDIYQDEPEYQHIMQEDRRSKLIVVEGQYYLLQPGQNWDFVKDDGIAKVEAQENYEKSKSNILTPKNILVLNKGLEIETNKSDLAAVAAKKVKNQEEQTFLNNQAGVLQAALASAQNCLNNPNLNLTPPKPTISSAAPQAPAPSMVYKAALKEEPQLQNQRKSQSQNQPDAQAAFRNKVHKYQGPYAELLKLELRLMPLNTPIPPLIMQRMLQTMETFGVKATKPGITPIRSPLDLKNANLKLPSQSLFDPKPEPQKKAAQKKESTPTPFSIKPDPY